MRSKSQRAFDLFLCFVFNIGKKHLQRPLVTFRQFCRDRQGSALSMCRLVSSRAELALTFAFCIDSILGTWHLLCLPGTPLYGTHHPETPRGLCFWLPSASLPPLGWAIDIYMHSGFNILFLSFPHKAAKRKILPLRALCSWIRTSDS